MPGPCSLRLRTGPLEALRGGQAVDSGRAAGKGSCEGPGRTEGPHHPQRPLRPCRRTIQRPLRGSRAGGGIEGPQKETSSALSQAWRL